MSFLGKKDQKFKQSNSKVEMKQEVFIGRTSNIKWPTESHACLEGNYGKVYTLVKMILDINLKVFDMFMSDEIMVIYKKFSIDAVYGKFGW
ncbi:hypothetical protein RIR_jg16006.t1 [Rhizophagus irregularis DAOM 181602=DAOM 197198]|nr:hypothetical protein RIR_jg16006.t1 [Rhizophagus irregularis DAOM 181602=DAOM 197198]